jgi:hypothetical protein
MYGIPMFILGTAFVVLKLLDKIDWDWWIVTAPFYGGVVLWIALIMIFGSAALALTKKRRRHRSF